MDNGIHVRLFLPDSLRVNADLFRQIVNLRPNIMTQEHIQIPRKITNQLLHLAQISPNLEVCGLIGSKNGLPSSCYPIKNNAEQPQQRFQLDAEQQI